MYSGQSVIKKFNLPLLVGAVFIGIAILVVGLVFFPVAKQEISYQYRQISSTNTSLEKIIPVDTDFGIVIPKLRANSKIIANVDPYNSFAYQRALTQGVAHANGTKFPGEKGNVFLFAHSSSTWALANQYNSVFYLLYKLDTGDEIDVYYQGKKFVYTVVEQKIVSPSEISYLTNTSSEPILTLMTCWPAGTAYKRLLVIAKIVNLP